MARTATAHVECKLSGSISNSSTGATDAFSKAIVQAFSNGTGAGKVQRHWEDQRTLTTGATEDIDVYDFGALDIGAGAGLDALGQSMALTGIKAVLITNLSTSTGNLEVGNKAATTAWQSMFVGSGDADAACITLAPGASFLYIDPSAAGLAVADTSNHLLTMTDSGGGCVYEIHILGI